MSNDAIFLNSCLNAINKRIFPFDDLGFSTNFLTWCFKESI